MLPSEANSLPIFLLMVLCYNLSEGSTSHFMKALNLHICKKHTGSGGNWIIRLRSDGSLHIPRDVVEKGILSAAPDRAESEIEAVKSIMDSLDHSCMLCRIEIIDEDQAAPEAEECPFCGSLCAKDSLTCPACGGTVRKGHDYERSATFIQGLMTVQKITGINAGALLRDFVSNTLLSPFDSSEKAIIFRKVEKFMKKNALQKDWVLSIFRDFAHEAHLLEEENSKKGLYKLIIPVSRKSGIHSADGFREAEEDCRQRGDIEFHKELICQNGAVLWDIVLPGQISTSPLIEEHRRMLEGGWNGLFFYGPQKEISWRFFIDYVKKDRDLDPAEWKRFAPPSRKKYPQSLRKRIYWVKITDMEKLAQPRRLEEFIKQTDNNPLKTSYLRNFTIVREKPATDS